MAGSKSYQNVIDSLSIGVVIADPHHRILYHNGRFAEWFASEEDKKSNLVGQDFYRAIGSPQFIDGCFAPFYFSRLQQGDTRTILSYPHGDYLDRRFEMLVSMIDLPVKRWTRLDGVPFKIELKEISEMNRFEQQLETLRRVGNDLAFFTNEKLHSSEEVLKEQLKRTIENQMRKVLNYDVFEIRTLNRQNIELVPFLDFGMDRTAASRRLFVKSNDNGITGFVASSREPYVCNDTKNDPLYLQGAINAKSSITVPLLFNNEVIGVCNVESRRPNAFSTQDLVFLELYAKDLAFAIHLLEYTRDKDSFVRQACNRLLHHDLDSAFHAVLEDVCETASAIQTKASQDDPEHVALAQKVDRLISDSYALRELFEKSTQGISTSQVSVPKESAKEDFPCFEIADVDKWAAFEQTLSKKKILLISRERQTLSRYGNWLKRLGCRVDYVNSSKMALLSLKNVKYDVVICERNPDGDYFPEVSRIDAHSDTVGVNEFNFSRYDVHEGEDYFVPAKNNDEDASERLRIRHEIYVEGKLDAYFLLKEIYKLGLDPTFILASNEAEHNDPTHVRPKITKLRKSHGYVGPEPTFVLMTENDKVWRAQRAFFKKLDSILR